MADTVVGVLIGKLGAALRNEALAYGVSQLSNEASNLKGLVGEICKAKEELESIKAYLHDSDKFKETSETTGIFVKKIRDLAFRIEDVVDEFTYKLEGDKHEALSDKVRKRVRRVNIWSRLCVELRSINDELEDTVKRRDRYAVPGMERNIGSYYDCRDTRSNNQTMCFAREDDLVGIQDNVDKMTQWLVGDLEEKKNKIVTVWGMGGAGKTTLVHHVYKAVKEEFDTAAWVTVSKSYKVAELLANIARELAISADARNMELIRLVELIRSSLKGKRYIIVLDDVWEADSWINIMDVFPTNCTSRFVLTSRKYEVASLATSNCTIKLEPLEENLSWKLFCNVAFRDNSEKRCPSELQELPAKFLQKCEGLPLAIACIGRLLSCKPLTYKAWENIYKELQLQSTKNAIPGVDMILKVSLEDLPCELKNCFLHCAIFPEDYQIKRRRLIRHWITAGFIKEKERKTLEQEAEGYLNELVNRSLLQVVKTNEFGRVKHCRMHDVIRSVALDQAEKECFAKVYEGSKTFSIGTTTRRLSIQSTDIAMLGQSGAAHMRAIYAFTSYVDIDLLRPILASSNLLATLDLQGTQINMLPNEVFSMFNLRFLGLRHTRIEVLPEAVGRLQNLEVLDAFGTALLSLPQDITKLKKLRFLYASARLTEGNLARFGGVKVPRGIMNLTGLHALQSVKASLETICDCEVAALTELRTFTIADVTSEHSSNLCNAITKMRHLASLSMVASSETEVLQLEELDLPKTLSKLELIGQLEKKRMPQIISSWSYLHNLTRLSLLFSKLDEDSFSSLMVLRGLCFLELGNAYDGKKLCFSASSFPALKKLGICGAPQLNQVEIEEGGLRNLVMLWFLQCPELKCLPNGIERLTSLEDLYLYDTAQELIEKLRQEVNECGELSMKISHIRRVSVKLTKDNMWERIRWQAASIPRAKD
ncbi:disease resistance protein RPM1 [Sorghum bicolor]|uniref:disease resistance protein RPM1 n=1 Tax=Sorghum bicolor TaxID=4558 RepID=UPI000B425392|nr:disease resistance protein RPM1 [Sorghum bicolor]|eukprot:XP_002450471.2 disease resistance protein RPM1 [Sorghum bicolor]